MENLGLWCGIIAFPFFFLAWAAALNRFRPRFYWLWMATSFPAFVAFTIVLILCVGARLNYYRSLPNVVFRESFGFELPSDVKVVNSSDEDVIDWTVRQLEFYADRSTIDRIVKGGYKRVAASDIREERNAPWWGPIEDEGTEFYATNIHDKTIPSRYFAGRILIYQPSSKRAYYRGVD